MLVVGDLLREVLDVLVELVPLRRELLDLRLEVREGLLLLRDRFGLLVGLRLAEARKPDDMPACTAILDRVLPRQ